MKSGEGLADQIVVHAGAGADGGLALAEEEFGEPAFSLRTIGDSQPRLPVVVLRIVGAAVGLVREEAGALVGQALGRQRAAGIHPLRRSGYCWRAAGRWLHAPGA